MLNQSDIASGTRKALIPDVQRSILATLDSGSGALSPAGYLPYGGNPINYSGTFRYTAQRIDPETAGSTSQPGGLYYYRARMYSPAWGRFLQPDPIGFAGGVNLYAYAENDPINLIDPSGTDALVMVGLQTSSNPFGHAAIAVTGAGVYSFGTGTQLGSSAVAYLQSQASYRTTVVYYIQTTPQQDQQMLSTLKSYGDTPIGILSDNCACRTMNALNSAGIYDFTNPLSLAGESAGLPENVGGIGQVNATAIITVPQGTEANHPMFSDPILNTFNPQPSDNGQKSTSK